MLIIIYNIYIIYNNGSVNHPHSEKINYPTVIGVIVIGVIAVISPVAKRNTPSREITAHFSLHFVTLLSSPPEREIFSSGGKIISLAWQQMLHYITTELSLS